MSLPPAGPAIDLLQDVLDQPVSTEYPLCGGEDPSRWRKAAHKALDALVERHLLASEASTGETLGRALLRAATRVHPALDALPGRVRMLGELLRNLARPGRINQGHKGTCAVTCVEIHLAERHPAEYARILADLIGEAGEARLQSGDLLRRDEDRLCFAAAEADRSPVSRLFQVAAMELAYPEFDYVNDLDSHVDRRSGAGTGTGVGLDAFDRLLEGLTGERWDRLSLADRRAAEVFSRLGVNPDFVPDLERHGPGVLRRSLEAGVPVFVTLDQRRGLEDQASRAGENPLLRLPHKVRVLAIDEGPGEPAGRIVYDDPLDPRIPWLAAVETRVESAEGRCSMASADFFRLMAELSYQPRFLELPPA